MNDHAHHNHDIEQLAWRRWGRVERALHGITLRIFALPPVLFTRFCLDLRLLERLMPATTYRVPEDVEAGRVEGWCLIGKGAGGLVPSIELPLALRDDADGKQIGEAVAVENRGGDLWALLLWRETDETDEDWASRVRMAAIIRDVPVIVRVGGDGTEATVRAPPYPPVVQVTDADDALDPELERIGWEAQERAWEIAEGLPARGITTTLVTASPTQGSSEEARQP